MKPFLPFTRPSIDAESIAKVADVLRSGQLASGPKVAAFEAALAAYLGGSRHVRVMTSATAGLEMADTPVAARVGRETVTLPLFPAMTDEDVGRVVSEINEVLK